MDPGQQASLIRMRDHAQRYLADASFLQQRLVAESDGASLLQLIAFEILLKAVLRAHEGTPTRDHKYTQLFDGLTADIQGRVLAAARARFGPHADFSDLPRLLSTWSSNFVDLRYAYEAYDGMEQEEVAKRSAEWMAAGASIEEADFKYYPMELRALTEALIEELSLCLQC